MEINTVSTLVGLSRHPLSCLISRSPRSSSTLFFVFSFPFLSLPPSSFSLSFLVGSLSLWWRRYYWPPVPRECRITLERDGSHLALSIVLLGRFLNFSRDWIGEGFLSISSLGCFPVLEKRESCSSSKEPIFLFVRDNSGSMISRVSINFILDRMEEYRGILRNIERKISNTFCEVNFKAMKRKKKSRNTKEWIIGRWINQLCKGEERGGIVAVGGNETERMKRFKGFCC